MSMLPTYFRLWVHCKSRSTIMETGSWDMDEEKDVGLFSLP